MVSLQGFDASKVETISFEPIPAGTYTAAIVKSEQKPTKKGDGWYMSLELDILEGQHKGRKIFDLLNLENPNPTAMKIANGTLSAICHAVNILTPNDSSELHNIPLQIVTKLEKYNDDFKSVVKAYKPIAATYSEPIETTVDATSDNTKSPWARLSEG